MGCVPCQCTDLWAADERDNRRKERRQQKKRKERGVKREHRRKKEEPKRKTTEQRGRYRLVVTLSNSHAVTERRADRDESEETQKASNARHSAQLTAKGACTTKLAKHVLLSQLRADEIIKAYNG